jgi:hypothetical protein
VLNYALRHEDLLGGGKWRCSDQLYATAALTPVLIDTWVGLRAGMDVVVSKKKSLPLPGIEH